MIRAAVLAFCTMLVAVPGAAGQNSSAFVPPDHWSYSALRRLDALGWLQPGSDPGRRTVPQQELRLLLDSAVERSADHPIARAYRERFSEEFRAGTGFSFTDARVEAGVRTAEGSALAGEGYLADGEWTGARPLDDEEGVDARARAAVADGPFAAALGLEQSGSKSSIGELHGVLASSTIGLWGGRRQLGVGFSRHGSIALTNAEFDGAGLFLNRPVVLPSFLRHLGPIRVEAHVTQIDNIVNAFGAEQRTEPYLHASRFSFEPHPRFRVGINRVMMFGGEGNEPVNFRNVAKSLIGNFTANSGLFANQVVSVDATFRVPVSCPLLAYLEWGADDTAGGWKSVPALSGGIRLPMLPRAPDLALDVTGTWFSGSCCGNAIWYRNHVFRGSWADDGVLLGHELGGHGRELAATLTLHARDARLRAEVTGLLRHRGEENVFAPQRAGNSTGGEFRFAYRLDRRVELDLGGAIERGSGDAWSRSGLRARVRSTF